MVVALLMLSRRLLPAVSGSGRGRLVVAVPAAAVVLMLVLVRRLVLMLVLRGLLVLWAGPRVVLRRRRELALLDGAPAAAAGLAAGAPGPPVVGVDVPVGPPAGGGRPRRRRRDGPQRAVLGVVGVVRAVLQRRRGGALVLAHLVEVHSVTDIVLVPGPELGHGRAFLHVVHQPTMQYYDDEYMYKIKAN